MDSIHLIAISQTQNLLFISSRTYSKSIAAHLKGKVTIDLRFLNDGNLIIGASYIPKPYFYRFLKNSYNPGLPTYITYSFTPFLELMFRYTHELNRRVISTDTYFPDRMIALKLNLIKESQNFPGIAFGSHDFSKLFNTSNLNINSMYSTNYIVSSKKFQTGAINLDLTLGYAFDLLSIEARDIKGTFGGLSINTKELRNLELLFEYDSKSKNLGIRYSIKERLNLMVGYWDMQKLTYSINFKLIND